MGIGLCMECGGNCDASFQPRLFEIAEVDSAVCNPPEQLNGIDIADLGAYIREGWLLTHLKMHEESAQYWCNACFTEETGSFACVERADWEGSCHMNLLNVLVWLLVLLCIGLEVAEEARENGICTLTRRRFRRESKDDEAKRARKQELTDAKTIPNRRSVVNFRRWSNACFFSLIQGIPLG